MSDTEYIVVRISVERFDVFTPLGDFFCSTRGVETADRIAAILNSHAALVEALDKMTLYVDMWQSSDPELTCLDDMRSELDKALGALATAKEADK